MRADQLTSSLPGVLGAPSVNPNDPSTFKSNPILAYAINKGAVLSTSYLGGTGLDFIGFGKFSTDFPIGGIMMRDPAKGDIWIYDVTQDSTGRYVMSGKLAISGNQLGSKATATPVGLAPLNANLNETDLVLQDKSGNLWFYDIQKDAVVTSGSLMQASNIGQPFTEAFGADLSSIPLVPLSGAIDSNSSSSTAVSQLAQAMAGFGGSGDAAVNTAPLGADASQQTLLTTPQHT